MNHRGNDRCQDLGSGLSAWPGKLTPEQRAEIRQRRADGEPVRTLALEYKVSTSTIRQNS